ncbi:hypothetical protein NUACC21_53130 [Scytonema sp. NUACC21]
MQVPMLRSEERGFKTLRRNIRGILLLACLVLCILIVGVNGFLVYRGVNLQEYTQQQIRYIPYGFWVNLGIASAQSIGILILAGVVVKFLHLCLIAASKRAKNFEQNTADDRSIDAFFHALDKIATSGIWLLAVIWCTQCLQVPAVVSQYLYIILRIYLIFAVGLLILKAAAVIIDSLDALSIRYRSPDNLLRFYDRLRHLVPFFKRCLEFAIAVSMTTLALQQVELIANIAALGPRIIKVIGIIFISRVLFEVVNLIVEEVLFREGNLTDTQRSRRLTLVPLIRSFLKYLIYFGATIFILYTIDIDPTPILAGAGIVGITVGLGAQHVVNDVVCGFFVLFENYYLVGDYVEVGKTDEKLVEGIVEAIELRTTRVRHPNGQLQIIRNGELGSITNYSKQYIYAVVEVGVPYDSNLAQVYRVIEEVGQQIQADYPDILEPTQVDGVENLGETNLLLRTVTKVKPGKHLQIQRLLRKIFTDAFIQEGIAIPVRVEN